MTCSLFRPFSANISKSTKVIILCFQEISPSIVHILKSHLVLICQQHLFSTPIVLFSCTPFGIKLYIYIRESCFCIVGDMHHFREVSRTRTVDSIERHTSDLYLVCSKMGSECNFSKRDGEWWQGAKRTILASRIFWRGLMTELGAPMRRQLHYSQAVRG